MKTFKPWEISRLATPDHTPQFGIYEEKTGAKIATVNGEDRAKLIAAAPEMLAFIEEVAAMLREHPEFEKGNSKVHYLAHRAESFNQ